MVVTGLTLYPKFDGDQERACAITAEHISRPAELSFGAILTRTTGGMGNWVSAFYRVVQ